MNKKTAFIIEKLTDSFIGGEPAIHYNFINFLISQGCIVDVYCANNVENPQKFNFNIFHEFAKNQADYIKQLNQNNYDLIISSRYGLKFKDLKADIYTIHSHSDLFSQKNKFGFWYNLIKPKRKKIKNEIRNLNRNKNATFIFCSNQLKNDYNSLAKLDNSYVIYPYPNSNAHAENKNSNEIFTFGISALGFQNKGGYLTLQSAFLLKLFGKNFKLKIIYKKKPSVLHKFLVLFLGLRKNVEFLPKQSNMTDFYNSLDCLLMPSQLESFGMVALEALYSNIPVIVSSNCGITELITDKVNGLIFKFDKYKSINLFTKMKYIMVNHNCCKNQTSEIKFLTMENYNQKFLNLIEENLNKQKNSKPEISIIVPVYNSELYLKDCLNSLKNQTLKNLEFICIDDGSTDNSLYILKEYAQNDNRFVIVSKSNEGQGIARNEGIKIATGKYIMFLDSDDWLTLDAAETIFNKAKDTQAEIIQFNIADYNNSTGKTKYKSFAKNLKKHYGYNLSAAQFYSKDLIQKCCFSGYSFYSTNKAYLREFLQRHKIEFSPARTAEDQIFSISAILNVDKIYYTDKYLYVYRHRAQSTSTTVSHNNFCVFDNIKRLENYLTEKGFYTNLKQGFETYKTEVLAMHYRNVPDNEIKKYEILSQQELSKKDYLKMLNIANQTNSFAENIFSIKNKLSKGKKYKILTIFGLKFNMTKQKK